MASREAYEVCRKLTAKHGKTYYFSTCFFPPEIRRAVHSLYGFVRCPDEIVDNPEAGANPERLLADFRAETLAALQTGESSNPVLEAFAETARRFEIPLDYPLAFLDAMAMDLTRDRYQTFDDLLCYTYGSASVVGLMMCRLIGMNAIEGMGPAHDLGLAMQLTNFLRDVGEDWVTRGRIYLPLDDMEQFNYSQKELAAGILNDNFRRLMKFQIARARSYYESADSGMRYIPYDRRLPVRLARILYSRILDKIEENDYDVFRKRAATSLPEKFVTALKELRRQGVELPARIAG